MDVYKETKIKSPDCRLYEFLTLAVVRVEERAACVYVCACVGGA